MAYQFIAIVVADHYLSLLCENGTTNPTQCAINKTTGRQAKPSVIVPHDICHAHWCVVYQSVHDTLTGLGFHDYKVGRRVVKAVSSTLYMRGLQGVLEVIACLLFVVVQGCRTSPMVLYMVNDIMGNFTIVRTPLLVSHVAFFRSLRNMHDTT